MYLENALQRKIPKEQIINIVVTKMGSVSLISFIYLEKHDENNSLVYRESKLGDRLWKNVEIGLDPIKGFSREHIMSEVFISHIYSKGIYYLY